MKYCVKTFRDAGLEARWSRTRKGAPIIVVKAYGEWFVVDRCLWAAILRGPQGVAETVRNWTLLGKFFSIPA